MHQLWSTSTACASRKRPSQDVTDDGSLCSDPDASWNVDAAEASCWNSRGCLMAMPADASSPHVWLQPRWTGTVPNSSQFSSWLTRQSARPGSHFTRIWTCTKRKPFRCFGHTLLNVWHSETRYRGKRKRGRRKNLLCSVALSVIKARAQAVSESPVKFAVCVTKKTDTQPQAQVGLQANRLSVNDEALKTVDLLREAGANTKSIFKFIVNNSDSNRTLRNVQNQIRNLKKCELGVTTRSHRVKKGLLDFCAVPGNTGRIFVNSSNEKRIATCITLQTKHMVDIFNRFPRTIRATRCPTEQAQCDDRNLNNCNYNALKKSKFKISRVPPEVRFFFTIDTTDGVVYKCNNYSETPACAVNTGYTNLHKHLTKCIGKDHDAKYASAVKARRNGLGFEVIEYVSERDLTVFKWIVWVLMRNMSLSEVDNPLTRELAGISSSDHVSSRSLSTYIKYLVPLVEALVEKILPLPFGVMLDGWTTKSTHYVAVPEDQSRAVEQ
ncbi:hypothetical protein PI124_g14092 [Phytophthora idaei]|nr:hypothetical protein PI124_g14092 [Phytophthora idaei]